MNTASFLICNGVSQIPIFLIRQKERLLPMSFSCFSFLRGAYGGRGVGLLGSAQGAPGLLGRTMGELNPWSLETLEPYSHLLLHFFFFASKCIYHVLTTCQALCIHNHCKPTETPWAVCFHKIDYWIVNLEPFLGLWVRPKSPVSNQNQHLCSYLVHLSWFRHF